jgi:hypothetical protein
MEEEEEQYLYSAYTPAWHIMGRPLPCVVLKMIRVTVCVNLKCPL